MYPPIPSDLIGELQFNDDRWVNVLAARRGGGGWGGGGGRMVTPYNGLCGATQSERDTFAWRMKG